MNNFDFNIMGTLILAAGGLGTMAFGIVEALKWWDAVGELGFGSIRDLTHQLRALYVNAYGENYEKLLRSQYRGEQEELARTLRQGARIGLRTDNAGIISKFVGVVSAEKLSEAALHLNESATLVAGGGNGCTPQEREAHEQEVRSTLGRFELAVDARIDAALATAVADYGSSMRLVASFVALGTALGVGGYIYSQSQDAHVLLLAALIGLGAVPIAPIAKDLVTTLQSVAQALRGGA